MTAQAPDILRQELLLEQAITERLDALVRQATETTLLLDGNRDMEVSQLRNLLNVSVETRSVEVVINFIRYQIARNGRAWGVDPKSFGHQVIADLRGPVRKLANEAAREISPQLGGTDVTALEQTTLVRFMQLYLGYLQRTFYFAKRINSFESLREVTRGT